MNQRKIKPLMIKIYLDFNLEPSGIARFCYAFDLRTFEGENNRYEREKLDKKVLSARFIHVFSFLSLGLCSNIAKRYRDRQIKNKQTKSTITSAPHSTPIKKTSE